MPLCAKYASGISRYVRRFLTPHPNPETGATEEFDRTKTRMTTVVECESALTR